MSFPGMQRVASNPALSVGPSFPSGMIPRSNSSPNLGAMPNPFMSMPSALPPQSFGPGEFSTMMGPPPMMGSSMTGPPPMMGPPPIMGPPSTMGPSLPPSGSIAGMPPSGSFVGGPPLSAPLSEPPTARSGSLPPPAFFRDPQSNVAGPGEVVIEITRLLDMPMQEKMLSGDLKQYRVRLYDENNKELAQTKELVGTPEAFATSGSVQTETIRLGKEGNLRANSGSPVLFLQVEYAGGFIGNTRIGRCRIARNDQRSREVWPYALSNKNDEPVGSGIELRVIEGGPPQPPHPLQSPVESSFQTMPMQPEMPRPMPPSGPLPPPGSLGPSFHTMPPMQPNMPPPMPPPSIGPSFHTMPPMDAGAAPGSFSTIPPTSGLNLQAGKGMGKGTPPGTPPASSPRGMSPRTMPPGMMQPQTMPPGMMQPRTLPPGMMPQFQTMPPQNFQTPQVDRARMEDLDVTNVLNQLIHANGFANPTKGAEAYQIFGSQGEFKVYRKGSKELVFPRGAPPPYNLAPLFQDQMPATGTGMPGVMPGDDVAPVVAVVQVSKIADVPAPAGGAEGEFVLTLERVKEKRKELARAGPFRMEPQGKDLRQVQNCHAQLVTKAKMQELADGKMELCVAVWFKAQGANPQRIGATAPLSVSWKPVPTQMVEILHGVTPTKTTPFGGLQLAHRFTDEQDLNRPMTPLAGTAPPSTRSGVPPKNSKEQPLVVGDVNGKSGKFEKGSQDEVIECATLAVEAQNRAILQRIKLANPHSRDTSGHVWTTPNGYRNWTNLDAVFTTMGPNYVAQSDEIGTNFCRVYEEDTSVWKELTECSKNGAPIGLGRPENKAEADSLKSLLRTMYPKDPTLVRSFLRPVVCKDVTEISANGLPDAKRKPICRVKIWSAKNLRSKSSILSGEAHPRVLVEIPNKPDSKWETSTADDGMHVQWNEEGVIPGYSYGDDLKFTVVDKEWIGFEDTLGEARLMGSDFYPTQWMADLMLTSGGKNRSSRGKQGEQPPFLKVQVMVESPMGKASQWPPEPPVFAPIKNLNPSDQETQRLANWDVTQCAKLPFADVNPNYQMNEDIWGALNETKAIEEGMLMEKPPGWKQPRVKDACYMA